MTIFVDVVLIENLIMNYIILLATGIIMKVQIKNIRLILGSLVGALYSIIAYASNIKIYTNIIMKIILSITIIFIAFNPQNVKKMWKTIMVFYLVSFVFGGVAFYLIYTIKPQNILIRNGMYLGTYILKVIVLGAIIAFLLCIVVFEFMKEKLTRRNMICRIKIKLNGKEIETNAMIDSGNLLKEPITNTAVVILEHTLLYECIPKEILNNLKEILGGNFSKLSEIVQQEYIPKLKLIPYSSLGRQNGMLIGLKLEKINIYYDEKIIENKNVIAGIYEGSLTKRGEYRALIGIELLN